MDNLPYDNPEQLVYCLQATFKGSSNEEVTKATEVLHRMSKDIIRFANSLMNIVINDHTDEKNLNIKNSACLALSSLLVNMAREEIISIEQKGCLLEIILNTMFTRDVALALKITLQSALQELYSVDKEQELRTKSLQIISHKLDNGAIEDYSAAFLVLQCVIKTPGTHKENLSKWFIGLRDSLLTSSTNLINGIVEEIKEAMGSQNHNEKFNNVFVGLKILKIWISTLKIYIDLLGKPTTKRSKTIHSTHIQHIISQESIVNVLSTVLTLQIPTEKQLPQCLFSTSGVTGVDQALNGVKAQVIKCFNKVLEFVFKSKALLNQNFNKFFAFASNMGVQGVLQSVFMLCESPAINLEEAMMDQDLQDCMVESLIFLSHLTSYNHLYQLFSNFHKRLVMNVCIPLLRTTPSELEKFERNPSEFVSIAVDTCDEQHSRIAKAQAANLLEHLCDNIDGAVSFTTIAVIAIIDYSLQFNTLEVIQEKYTTLNEYKEGLFISKTDVKIRIETCLVVLCNISYLISKRKDLIEPVENMFINYREMFYNDKADPLIRVRMCLIVSYFFEVLFQRQSQKEHLAMQLRFVVESLDVYNHEGLRAIAEQAVDALCNIFLQDNLRPKLRDYLPEIIDKLASHIRVTDNVAFFDIIEELFTNYTKRLISTPNLIAVLIDAMVKRIQTECQAKERSEKVQDIIFNKIWNIFREISQDTQFIPTHQEDIEKLMTPLFAYLEREQRAPFEEEIMAYVTSVTKVSKHVSSSCWKIFKTFPSIFLRCKKLLSSVFPALNQIIIYGQETLRKDQASLQELVEMAIQGLNPSHNQATEANVSEACLLMHLIFQYLDTISNSDWERMLIACLERSKGVKRSYLQTRLGGVFLCSFVANFKLTWSILNNQNRISDLLNLYIGEAANFEHPYDRKVLLLGLSAVCMNGFTDPAIYERLLHIFNVLISFLKYIEYKDKVDKGGDDSEFKRKDRKMTNKEILQEFLSMKYAGNYRSKQDRGEIEHEDVNQANTDDENDGGVKSDEDSDAEADSGDDTCLMHTDEAEAKATLETLETDWLAKDEFVIFKNVVYTLRHQNEAMIVELVNQLPMSKKEILNEVLNSQRITVDVKGGKAETEARKIVKTKTRKIATNLDLNNQ